MTKNEFGAGIARLVVRYGQAFATPQLDAWYADLKKVPAGKFSHLIGVFLREVETWPWRINLPARLRQLQKQFPYSRSAPADEKKWRRMTPDEMAEMKRIRDKTTKMMRVEKED